MELHYLRPILETSHKKYAVYLGTATSALAIACHLSSRDSRKIALPSICCVSVLHAVLLAGCKPVFVDVSSDTGLMDTNHFLSICEADPDIEAVIAVHLYGFILDMEPLLAASSKYGVSIIEDFAQCQGARYSSGQSVGSLGNFSVLSFGHTKVLDVGGGGLLLTDDVQAYKEALHISSQYVTLAPSRRSFLADSFRQSYYETWSQKEVDQLLLSRISDMAYSYQSLYLRQGSTDEFNRLITLLPGLEGCTSRRRFLWSFYYNYLSSLDGIDIPLIKDGDIPWRFTLTVSTADRDPIVSFLRSREVDVSTWYAPLFYFSENDPHVCRNYVAESFSSRVINLWLDPQTTEDQVSNTCSLIHEFFAM